MAMAKLTAAQKAAVVLLSLGEDLASEIMSHMSQMEVRRIASAMQLLGRVAEETVQAVADEFQAALLAPMPSFRGDAASTQRLLARAGHVAEAAALDGSLGSGSPRLTETLVGIDARILAGYLTREHPQTMAIVLAHCEAKQAGDTLRLMPAAVHTEVLQRMARLGPVDDESLEAILTSLRQETERLGNQQGRSLGGIDKLVALINGAGGERGAALLAGLAQRDPDLAAKVQAKLFTFSHLTKIGDRGMQLLLAQVPAATLAVALKGAATTLASHVYKNMSTRAAQRLRDDVAALPKLRVSDVEAAQQAVVSLAQSLAAAGKLEIMSSEEAYV